jgi:hypothetical protein
VQPSSTDDVVCAWNDGYSVEWDYDMCQVNAINSENSVQIVCDCQQSGIVKIESDLGAPSEEADLFEETSMLDDEVAAQAAAAQFEEETPQKTLGEKSLLVGVVFALLAYML